MRRNSSFLILRTEGMAGFMLEQKIQEIVSKYIDEEIAVDAFQEQFAGLYFAARKNPADRAAARLCNEIVGPLAEYGRGVGGEELLRQRLRPFAAVESQAPNQSARPKVNSL